MSYGTRLPPLLTRVDEQTLGRALRYGRDHPEDPNAVDAAERARKRFIESNIRLVLALANRVRIPAHLDREDVVQDGMLGLERAVEKYDPTKGFKFSTYAAWWIRQSMQRGLEQRTRSIRIPEHRVAELRAARRDLDDHAAPLGPELQRLEQLQHTDSLDRTIDDGRTTLADALITPDPDPSEVVATRLLHDEVARRLEDLDAETAEMVARRYGLRGHPPHTYARIAESFAIGEEAVRRRVERSLAVLRPWFQEVAA